MMRELCRLDSIPDGGARGFPAAPGGFTGLFAVRQGEAAFVYVNCCPHVGTALDSAMHAGPGRFLTADGERLRCATHGALFGIADGICTAGPCVGARLEAVPVQVINGVLLVPADAGL